MKQGFARYLIAACLIVSVFGFVSQALANKPTTHTQRLVFQALPGCVGGYPINDGGYRGITNCTPSLPGILSIDPGGTQSLKGWPNFVRASQPGGPSDGKWTVSSVVLRKVVPGYVCTTAIGGSAVSQDGANVQLWWPLMHELPGTQWTLTISYKTIIWDDDGSGPNLPATTHQDVWTWKVDATLESMGNLIKLFHELPAASCQVPLISGESIYTQLLNNISILKGMQPSNPEMVEVFNSFILLIEDSCMTVDCGDCGAGIGIRNTLENPACCKLLADADYVAAKLGLNQ
jgi:hypothetical protein